MNIFTKDLLERAVKTLFQTFLASSGLLQITNIFATNVDFWSKELESLEIAATATLLSLLTSFISKGKGLGATASLIEPSRKKLTETAVKPDLSDLAAEQIADDEAVVESDDEEATRVDPALL